MKTKIVHVIGRRGVGDIVSGLSLFFKRYLKTNAHFIGHFPPGHNYENTFPSIMEAFDFSNSPFKVTYEYLNTNYSINVKKGFKNFPNAAPLETATDQNFNEFVCPLNNFHNELYWPFKKKWKRDFKGPILLTLNHEHYNEHHPVFPKFFDPEINDKLRNLVDNKRIYELGVHHSFEKNLELISSSIFSIGIEGGWTHITNCMRAPFIIVRNNRSVQTNRNVHPKHPSLRIIELDKMFKYLKINPSYLNTSNDNKIT